MKLKLIAAAALFAVAGQASASIANGATGNGELMLSVYDASTLTSYTRDLGITMDDFIANGNTLNRSFAADALLTSTFSMSNSNLLWNVAALDSFGANRYLSTSKAALATVKTTVTSNLNAFSAVNNYVNAVNSIFNDGVNTTINGSVMRTSTGPTDLAYFGNGFKNNWLSKAGFDSTAAIGQSQSFYLITPGASPIAKVNGTQFAGTAGNAAWKLDANGTLKYTVATAPVPVPAAAWLLGSGLIGMMGVARRKAA